jgi:mannan endo-1,4-beta-mannosidase
MNTIKKYWSPVKIKIYIFLLFFGFMFSGKAQQNNQFVKVNSHQFVLNNKPLYYFGTNYWYGGTLGNTASGKIRLKKELDFLQKKGVTNLRVMVGAEGSGQINGVQRVKPPLQTKQGEFDLSLLNGLDYLLAEMGKRNLKAVLVLSNNWEWTGGFLQYLNWNGLIADSVMQRILNWDEYRDYVSKFYTCEPCKIAYLKQVDLVLKRKNKCSGKKYINDEAIMAWEIANEPRPMRPSANNAYKVFMSDVAAHIKSIDKNHLVTTGVEGDIGMESMELYEAIHKDKNVDYLTIHIWPKNWGWFKGNDIEAGFNNIISKTKEYILKHAAVAAKINKPLVIEEFGLPRNNHSFNPGAPTTYRDSLFKEIFLFWNQSKISKGYIGGCNFWAFSGIARPLPGQVYWKDGDDYLGDPPMEEQGLNSVFDSDTSTWNLINSFSKP